jgi:hypothetical protein
LAGCSNNKELWVVKETAKIEFTSVLTHNFELIWLFDSEIPIFMGGRFKAPAGTVG